MVTLGFLGEARNQETSRGELAERETPEENTGDAAGSRESHSGADLLTGHGSQSSARPGGIPPHRPMRSAHFQLQVASSGHQLCPESPQVNRGMGTGTGISQAPAPWAKPHLDS